MSQQNIFQQVEEGIDVLVGATGANGKWEIMLRKKKGQSLEPRDLLGNPLVLHDQ